MIPAWEKAKENKHTFFFFFSFFLLSDPFRLFPF